MTAYALETLYLKRVSIIKLVLKTCFKESLSGKELPFQPELQSA